MHGNMKGKKIPIPRAIAGHQNMTTQKIKESIFNIILNFFPDPEKTVFCDLFSGSGQIGIEALSRGFCYIIFCERDSLRLARLKRWLQQNSSQSNFIFFHRYGQRVLKEIVFFQPEYANKLNETKKGLTNLVVFMDPPYLHNTFDRINHIIEGLHTPESKRIINEQVKDNEASIENMHTPQRYQNYLYLLQAPTRMKINGGKNIFTKQYKYGNNQILASYF